ncbi:mercury methylation corrinoid protein HgcA [Thermodesulfobacteriota bacterium]
MNNSALSFITKEDGEEKAEILRMKQPFVKGMVKTAAGEVPQVGPSLTFADHFGTFKVRWNIGRHRYIVEPGLYALGYPDDASPVLVTANYKMSFDRLRDSLKNFDAWILVLDTDGVNVWCSAGKKTFGTEGLVRRIKASGLEKVVSQRQLIVPQLAGPGISAHDVKSKSGFKVIYGPIRASDLIAFCNSGLKATKAMRRKTFDLKERLGLIPVELTAAFKWVLLISLALFLIGGFRHAGWTWTGSLDYGLFAVFAVFSSFFAGALLTPLLLPWLPGRAFSIKGMTTGLITSLTIIAFRFPIAGTLYEYFEILGLVFLGTAFSAYLAMNFTGASTYTSLSGVKKEMKWAVPLEIGGGLIGLCLWLSPLFFI